MVLDQNQIADVVDRAIAQYNFDQAVGGDITEIIADHYEYVSSIYQELVAPVYISTFSGIEPPAEGYAIAVSPGDFTPPPP